MRIDGCKTGTALSGNPGRLALSRVLHDSQMPGSGRQKQLPVGTFSQID
jgi:hypothetical protein